MEAKVFLLIGLILAMSVLIWMYFKNKNFNSKEVSIFDDKRKSYNDEQLWEIWSANTGNIQEYKPSTSIKITDGLNEQINNIISLTPQAKEIVQKDKEIIIHFKNDVINKIKSGELKVMKKGNSLNEFRPLAVDGNNKIRGQGWIELKDAKKLNPTQLANVALGAMTVITAQEHLESINKQLTKIDSKVNMLLKHLSYEKIGKIEGSLRYLRTILSEVQENSKFQSVHYNRVENITHQTYNEIHMLFSNIRDILNEVNNVEMKTIYKADIQVDSLKDISNRYEQTMHLCLGFLEVLNVCLNLKLEITPILSSNENRISDVEHYLNELIKIESRFMKYFNEKIDSIGVKFNIRLKRAEYIEKRKKELNKQLDYLREKMKQEIINFKQSKDNLKKDTNFLNESVDLKIDYDTGGNISAIYKLESPS
ncbi:hypothetical protein [Virgibacillus ihumii]|uniref:hypothetical protein n=1 Tax=Virgibacillus ihumii TaxID=2686091 RepID=UPI00157D5F07|nr:hypothetical protein [Virgibacillus ihumii]